MTGVQTCALPILNQLLDQTHLLENHIKRAEISYLSKVRSFQILINLIISMVLILTVLNVSLPAVQVAMLIFLSLTGFEAALAWYPNLFSSGKLLNAKNKLKLIPEVSSQRKTKVAYGTIKANNFQPYWNQPNLTPIKDRKSTRLNSSHIPLSRMPSSA